MSHWKTAFCSPGFYLVSRGSNAVVRQFAVPLTEAAEHVAREREPQSEMYPFAHLGDLTPVPVVLINDVQELKGLERRAQQVAERFDDHEDVESATLGEARVAVCA